MNYPTNHPKNDALLELYLTNEEIAEIEGRNTCQPELDMAVSRKE
jgi:hypothetical protein